MKAPVDDHLAFNAHRPLASSELPTASIIDAQPRFPALVGGHGRSITVIKIPFSGGQNKPGVETGPEAMLADEFSLVPSIVELGWGTPSIVQIDCENPSLGPDNCLVPVEEFSHILNPTLVSDINVPQSSVSGKLHGCPVSFLLGLDMPVGMPGFKWLHPCLMPDRLAYLGVRDLDLEEKRTLKALEITAFSMKQVVQHGIEHVLVMALAAINPSNELPIHLSFDIDGLDPFEAPSTGTAVRGGLNFREGRRICEKLAETGNLVSMD
jgi:arginase family enzyme